MEGEGERSFSLEEYRDAEARMRAMVEAGQASAEDIETRLRAKVGGEPIRIRPRRNTAKLRNEVRRVLLARR